MEIKRRFDHFNINVTALAKSLEFYGKALGLKETGRKEAADGSFVLAYLGDGQTGFRLELTWLRDHAAAPYELGENERPLCMRVAGEYDAVREDIRAVKQAVGDKILKVIIETCLLTDDEKRRMCDIVCEAGADYIKTSTGFSTAGANFHDVELMVKGVRGRCKVKAAGGISTVDDMEKFLALGADRLGTSRAVKILNGEQAKGY